MSIGNITKDLQNARYLDDDALGKKLQRPDDNTPPWVLLQEVQRRRSGEQQHALAQSGQQTSTVMEDLLSGVNSSGLASAAPQGMPKQDNMLNMKTASAAPTQGAQSAMNPRPGPQQPPQQQGIKGYAAGGQIGGREFPRTNYIMDWANNEEEPKNRLESIGRFYDPSSLAKGAVRGIGAAAEGLGSILGSGADYLTEPYEDKTKHDYQVNPEYGPNTTPPPNRGPSEGLAGAAEAVDLGDPQNIVPEVRGGPAKRTDKADTGTVLKGLEKMVSSGQESDKNFNKWLAVAKMGMTIASGTSPSFATNVAKGGLAAASQLGEMNKQYKDAMEKAFNKNVKLAQLKETKDYHDKSIAEQRYATDAGLTKTGIVHESNILKAQNKEATAMRKGFDDMMGDDGTDPRAVILRDVAETQGMAAAKEKHRQMYMQDLKDSKSAVTGQSTPRKYIGMASGLY